MREKARNNELFEEKSPGREVERTQRDESSQRWG